MDLDMVARIGLAVSSPTRLTVLQLADGRHSLAEIAEAVSICPSSVTHHIRVLAEAGLVEVVRRGRRHVPRRVPDAGRLLARALG